jgi:hypothetical protein
MAIGQKTSASDRMPVAIRCENMFAERINLVPLECFRNALLDDENGPADCTKCVAIVGPIGQSQRKLGHPVHA